MPIPDYETLMLPVLRFAGDRKDHSSKELVASLAAQFRLTPEEQVERLPSGQQTVIGNRAGLLGAQDPGLGQVVAAWAWISPHLRDAILLLVRPG
jgi:restriction endonuclease Mrr